jgi:3-hydroxyisobutyrate dehydrogenase-like beta-hydroxyacid dehydrogenase
VTTVGVIGLGEIGRGVARAIVGTGLPLVVCDVNPGATAPFAGIAHIAAGPAEVGARADVSIVAVVNDTQVLAVTSPDDGLLATALPGTVIVVVSTVSIATVYEVARAALRRDVDVLDCGVSGGPGAASEGALVTMVGGDEAVVERHRAVLDAFSSLVVHMGPLGAGLKAKLARNLVQYGSWLAAFEGQRLAEAAGIDLRKLATVIRASDRRIGGAATLMFRDTVSPWLEDDDRAIVQAMRAAAGLAHKDLGAALELAEELGITLPVARMTDARCDAVFGVGPDPIADGEREGARHES